jgi:hypothetical protein
VVNIVIVDNSIFVSTDTMLHSLSDLESDRAMAARSGLSPDGNESVIKLLPDEAITSE